MRQIGSPKEIKIQEESDIVDVRQTVREIAHKEGFDPFSIAALVTASSELSRNIWTHAKMGEVKISIVTDGRKMGMELEFSDQGPGIAELEKALAGGYSTSHSLGLGLAGTKRLSDEFNIETAPGRGTKVTIRKWKKRS